MRKNIVGRNDLKRYTLDEVKDKLIGKRGTARREEYELGLQRQILADTIDPLSSCKNPLHQEH